MAQGNSVTIPIDLDTKSFDKQIDMVTYDLERLEEEYEGLAKGKASEDILLKAREDIEKTRNKLIRLNEQKEKWQEEMRQPRMDLSAISSHTDNIIRKVAKWGLALFSIRSVYSFIRGSISTISQSNEQIATDIEYIRWALATTLQPVIEFIIKLAYTLLGIINSISQAIFGVNLFANATAENFKKTKDNVKGTNTEAKKLQKTLAGFDEMNILQEDGSVASGGGGGGITLPSMDLSKAIEGFNLGEIFNGVVDTIKGLWSGFISFMENDILKFFDNIGTPFEVFFSGIGLYLQGLYYQWKGVFERIYGIFQIFVGIINGDFDLIKEGVGNLMQGIFDYVRGIFEKIVGLWTMQIGIFKGIAETIIGVIADVGSKVIDFFTGESNAIQEETTQLRDNKTILEELEETRNKIAQNSNKYIKAVNENKKAHEELNKAQENCDTSAEELYRKFSLGVIQYEKLDDKERTLLDAYIKTIGTEENLRKATDDLSDAKDKEVDKVIELTRNLSVQGEAYDENFKALIDGYRNGEIESDKFADIVLRTMTFMDKEGRIVFAQNLPNDITQSLLAMDYFKQKSDETKKMTGYDFQAILSSAKSNFAEVGSVIAGALDYNKYKSSANNIVSLFNKITSAVKQVGTSGFNIKVSTSGNAKGGLVTRLATGGIVSRPNKGVPVSGSIMGEAGREGIIPLTDAQAMETLGQAIGRYININANIPVYMGNRQIAREIRKIEANDEFAFNG